MTNDFYNNSRLKDKIIDVELSPEIIYQDDEGELKSTQMRHGRLDDKSIYTNKKIINTRYGQLLIKPRIKVYFNAFDDDNSILTINILNVDDSNLIKQFIIKSLNNDFLLSDMKNLCDEIKSILFGTENEKTKLLINLIRHKENLVYKEIAQ